MKPFRPALGTITLLAVSLTFATPALAETSAPVLPQEYHWVCTYEFNEGGISDVIQTRVPTKADRPVQVGDLLPEGEESYHVVGSITADPPSDARCLQLLKAALDKRNNDPSKTISVYSCVYQATEKGLVFVRPDNDPVDPFALTSNPRRVNVTPADSTASNVGDSSFGEGILSFVVAKADRTFPAPTKADCDTLLPKMAAKEGIKLGATTTAKPTAQPTAQPSRGVPAKTGVDDELPLVPLGLAWLAGVAGSAALLRRGRPTR